MFLQTRPYLIHFKKSELFQACFVWILTLAPPTCCFWVESWNQWFDFTMYWLFTLLKNSWHEITTVELFYTYSMLMKRSSCSQKHFPPRYGSFFVWNWLFFHSEPWSLSSIQSSVWHYWPGLASTYPKSTHSIPWLLPTTHIHSVHERRIITHHLYCFPSQQCTS